LTFASAAHMAVIDFVVMSELWPHPVIR